MLSSIIADCMLGHTRGPYDTTTPTYLSIRKQGSEQQSCSLYGYTNYEDGTNSKADPLQTPSRPPPDPVLMRSDEATCDQLRGIHEWATEFAT
eukprot:522657-Prorocentrum_minimum.AAC.1